MKILSISGSDRIDSANIKFLESIPFLFPKIEFQRFEQLKELPLYRPEVDQNPLPTIVKSWRSEIQKVDAVIICTPEYIYNIPALLKNALEWLTKSGELDGKAVLPITFTPNHPRGEKAMQSLLWSLQALNSKIVTQLPLYQNEIEYDDKNRLIKNESTEMLEAAIGLL